MNSLHLKVFPTLSPSRSSTNVLEDTLARESDVIVSTNITLYAEYKGFFVYVLSALTLTCWIGWTVIPDRILHDYLSIHYYPDKYWSHAIPAYFLMTMLYIYIALALYNTEVKTLKLDDIRNFVDDYSTLPGSSDINEDDRIEKNIEYLSKAPSGVWDLPVNLVNEVLYDSDFEMD